MDKSGLDIDVAVPPDGRGEVGVDGAGQPVVPEQRLLDRAAADSTKTSCIYEASRHGSNRA